MKLVVMLLTFQHLLLLGVLSIPGTPWFQVGRWCGTVYQLDTQESKN
jgi:hypothetical protein